MQQGLRRHHDARRVDARPTTASRGDVFTDSYTSAASPTRTSAPARRSASAASRSAAPTPATTPSTPPPTTTADITAAGADGHGAPGVNKVYDGTTTATVTLSRQPRLGRRRSRSATRSATLRRQERRHRQDGHASAASRSAAPTPATTPSTPPPATTADITPRALTVTAHRRQQGLRRHDARRPSTLSDDRVAGDVVTRQLHAAPRFADKNVGTGKTGQRQRHRDQRRRRRQLHASTRPPTTANITAAHADGHAPPASTRSTTAPTAGHRDAVATTASPATSFTDSYASATLRRQERRHRQDGQRQRDRDQRRRRRQLHLQHHRHDHRRHHARALTVSATGVNKVYDGTTDRDGARSSDDRVAGDVFTDSYTSATFADKNVGTGKTVTRQRHRDQRHRRRQLHASTPPPRTTADITPRAADGHAPPASTRSTTAPPPPRSRSADDRVAGDVAHRQLHQRRASPTRTSAPARPVSVSGIAITGTDAGNYTCQHHRHHHRRHHGARLTVSATGVNKVYDGTTTATVTLVRRPRRRRRRSPTATHAPPSPTRTSARARRSRVTGISISGTDAGNYTFNTTAPHHGRHHAPRADGQRHRRQQGLRRHHHRDGHPRPTTASPATCSPTATRRASFADKNVGTGKT